MPFSRGLNRRKEVYAYMLSFRNVTVRYGAFTALESLNLDLRRGELMTLLRYLEPNWSEFLAEGEGEVLEVMEELGIAPSKRDAAPGSTVGSLIEK